MIAVDRHSACAPRVRRWLENTRPFRISKVFGLGMLLLAVTSQGNEATELQADELVVVPEYALGSGWRVPGSDFTLGGYSSAQYSNIDADSWRANLSDLSAFVAWEGSSHWRAFTEFELGNGIHGGPGTNSQGKAEFDLERLYADYLVGDTLNWRFGKFLTPIGRWNQIHADPLVWTVSRPLVTDAAFARHATGVMAYGNIGTSSAVIEYQVYADATRHLDPTSDQELIEDEKLDDLRFGAFDSAFGARMVAHLDGENLQLGVSYANFSLKNLPQRKNLLGFDITWAPGRMEYSAEFTYRNATGTGQKDEWGGFLQAVVPLPGNWFGVGRYEQFDSALLPHVSRVHSLGLAFRPRPPLVFKFEYRSGRDNEVLAPDGALASVAVLF